jgi:two-component system, LuxR family, sensor kinase FixL
MGTELEEQSEAALLRAVFDSALDGLITIDEAGLIQSFNPAAERQFGWKAQEVMGRNINMLMPEPYHSEHEGYMRRYLQTGVRRVIGIGREVTGLRRDGTTFPMDLAVTEVRLGSYRFFLGSVRDITEKKRSEGMRQALLAREAHQQGRIDMASGILHDLGNALTGIGGRAVDARGALERSSAPSNLGKALQFLRQHTQALEQVLGTPKAQALVEFMDGTSREVQAAWSTALESLAKLLVFVAHTQEVLTTYRGYSGAGASPPREHLDVRKILFDAQMMMSDSIAKRGGIIDVQAGSSLPRVVVERSKVMQVLVNLIKNSAEAYDTLPAGRPLDVSLEADPAPEGILIQVRDNGPGFEPCLAEQLFAEGYSTRRRGSGIGLGASRRLIESLGGRLELHSEGPGRGAVARILLLREPTEP